MPCIDNRRHAGPIGGKQEFSTLDAKIGYWQSRMGPTSEEKTAFNMPFGVCNGPVTIQRHMQRVLHVRRMSDFCNVYIDDIIVFSRTIEEHIGDLQQVFDRFRAVGLKLQPTKCEFACPSVFYLLFGAFDFGGWYPA